MVTAELARAKAEAEARHDKGFDLERNMAICEAHGVEWGSFPASRWPELANSPAFACLSNRQKQAVCFSLAAHPDSKIVFRTIMQTLGQGRTAGRSDDGPYKGDVILGTILPNTFMFVFNGIDPPRYVLGRESLALQCFPIDILGKEGFKKVKEDGSAVFAESLFQDLAGNMVSTPVMLATVMSTMAAVSWIEDEPPAESSDSDGFGTAPSPAPPSPGELSLFGGVASPKPTKAHTDPEGLMHGEGPKPRGCLLRRRLHDPAQRRLEMQRQLEAEMAEMGQAHGGTGHAHGGMGHAHGETDVAKDPPAFPMTVEKGKGKGGFHLANVFEA